jgi:outer membrane lipopolysaccharide assembly protein LptE/RlpB
MKYKRLGYRHDLKEQEELYDEVMEEIGHQIDVRLPSFNEKKVKKNKKRIKKRKNPNIKEEHNDF